jgi:hypothetical protein
MQWDDLKWTFLYLSRCSPINIPSCVEELSKGLSFAVLHQLKFVKTRSKFKVKVTRSKVLMPNERSPHNASISQVSKP